MANAQKSIFTHQEQLKSALTEAYVCVSTCLGVFMTKLFYRTFFEDIHNVGFNEQGKETLLDIFESRVKAFVSSPACRVWFSLADFPTYAKTTLANCELKIERKKLNGQTQYWGTFKDGDKLLQVIATLEQD